MPISKNAQVLKFFAEREPRGVGRTALVKLAYLADLEARQLLGEPISGFDYTYDHYGPFDVGIFEAIDELEAADQAWTQIEEFGSGMVKKSLVDAGEAIEFDFDEAEHEILEFVARRFGSMPLEALLDYVYNTPPMKQVTQRGERLPMERVDNSERAKVGFDFRDILAAEVAVKRGDWMLADDFFEQLQGQAGRAGPAAG